MTTLEMEVALIQHLNIRQNLIVPNIYWGMGLNYECDLVKLTSSGYATEIEIKVSKSDLLKDKEKRHSHNSHLFKYLYFAVPKELKDLALDNIPEKSGLYVVNINEKYYRKYVVDEVRKPLKKSNYQWDIDARHKLASLGAMRILGLKRKLLKL